MSEPARILVVDDDGASRSLMAQILAEDGHGVLACADGAEAVERLERDGEFDAVVSDIRMRDVDGLEVLDWVHKHAPETPVLLVTAFGNIDGAVEAIRRGAYDYISKPYDVNAIKLVVGRALRHRRLATENRRLKREIREKYALANVVGRSESMLQVYKTAARVALTDATVLVVGESGTGKELVARAIHSSSVRAAGPFVAVDCGAIAEGVLESELFGHARGSFTGATGARRGLFEEATGGTLFLDEVGDIGARIQGQLLRVLQEGEIRRVGESAPIRVDTRVVAATNKDLAEAVKAGRFREDLFYRLNVVTIRIPPLRERREDIPLLAEHFAARHAGERGASLTTEAREALLLWDWPGNVRELDNAVARALALNPGGTILPEDLPEAVRERWRPQRAIPTKTVATVAAAPVPALPDPLIADHPTLDELSRRYAERVLREAGGNKTRAAEALGIDRKTLSRLLREE
ncbi:MAG TPA: sigma-54 dependent transcriptional regulator [Myxococcales bacterium]|nr:sigma-54 dependent transcriptional regulator [Myxococcales bacterium]